MRRPGRRGRAGRSGGTARGRGEVAREHGDRLLLLADLGARRGEGGEALVGRAVAALEPHDEHVLAGHRVERVPAARIASAGPVELFGRGGRSSASRNRIHRSAALHRMMAYAPLPLVPLLWLGLLPIAVLRALDRQPDAAQQRRGHLAVDGVVLGQQHPAARALPGWARRPIVAMTATTSVDDRRDCLEAGMDDFVPKPFEPRVLFATLLRWLPPEGHGCRAPGPSSRPPSPGEALPEWALAVDGLDARAGLRRAPRSRCWCAR